LNISGGSQFVIGQSAMDRLMTGRVGTLYDDSLSVRALMRPVIDDL